MERTGKTLFIDNDGDWIPATGGVLPGYLSLPEIQGPGVQRKNSKSLVRGFLGPEIIGTSPGAVLDSESKNS